MKSLENPSIFPIPNTITGLIRSFYAMLPVLKSCFLQSFAAILTQTCLHLCSLYCQVGDSLQLSLIFTHLTLVMTTEKMTEWLFHNSDYDIR